MLFRQIFDPRLAQYSYLIGCQQTKEAIVIDPERDIDRYVAIAKDEGLSIIAVAETHIHADFLSGSREFAEHYGVTVYVSGEGGDDWQYLWVKDPKYQSRVLKDGDRVSIGNIEIKAVHTPGHTPEHICFLVSDRGSHAHEPMGLASGDFVFVGDLGRPDLLETAAGQKGARLTAAHDLYQSVRGFLTLPDFLQIWPGHGAGSACGKALGAVPASTVGYERRFNAAIRAAEDGERPFVRAILEGQPEPPLYFGRMKRLNREGPPLLESLSKPPELSEVDLDRIARRGDGVVIDTRSHRPSFMSRHIRGSLYAPLEKSFPALVGSYVDPDQPMYLIIESSRAMEAVRELVRIGLDDVRGYATPTTLDASVTSDAYDSIPVIDFDGVHALRDDERHVQVLDVRGAVEYAAGHVAGSLNIAHTRLAERLGELSKDRTILVHCAASSRAAAAAAFLHREGFDVQFVMDSFDRWARRYPELTIEGSSDHGTSTRAPATESAHL